jgi:hypothetical protein
MLNRAKRTTRRGRTTPPRGQSGRRPGVYTLLFEVVAEFLVAEGVVDDISHEGCGSCSARQECRFNA